jgi:S1/P1 Nuclease
MLARILAPLTGLLLAAPAFAWDNFGHMEVAQVAWGRLEPAVRMRVAQLLRLNPQYVAWTVTVAPEKRDQIAFLRAATWPDFIKSAPHYIKDGPEDGNRPPPGPEAAQNIGYADRFMHKYWHFIDEPFSTDGTRLEPPTTPNAQTQIALFRKTLASPWVSDDVKSYDLTWLLHLVGDIHQTLHATSRFSADLPHGDNGGNSEKISCGGCPETSLHWFWDDAPGVNDNPEEVIGAAKMLPDADPRQGAVRDENSWIEESFELAKQVVYQPPIGAGTGPFALTDTYKATAAQLARQRVALAGVRLANLLNTALAAPVDPRLGCDTLGVPSTLDAMPPEGIDFVKKRLLTYRCAAYEGDIDKVLGDAGRWVASRAPQVTHPPSFSISTKPRSSTGRVSTKTTTPISRMALAKSTGRAIPAAISTGSRAV